MHWKKRVAIRSFRTIGFHCECSESYGCRLPIHSRVDIDHGQSVKHSVGPSKVSEKARSSNQGSVVAYHQEEANWIQKCPLGSTLRPDDDASEQVYGRAIKAKDIVRSKTTAVPATGRHLVNTLQRSAPRNESERASIK
jgi:hypothetical protein